MIGKLSLTSPEETVIVVVPGDLHRMSPPRIDATSGSEETNARRLGYSPVKMQGGGGLGSYECCYGYTRNEWASTVGKRVRIALRFRGTAISAICSPRSWSANNSASSAYRAYGGSAQALIGT